MRMGPPWRALLFVGVISSAALLVAGCDDDGDGDTAPIAGMMCDAGDALHGEDICCCGTCYEGQRCSCFQGSWSCDFNDTCAPFSNVSCNG
ncbi:MAG: hypothetical protein ACI9MR_003366 [Myxococcota bacterium]|jgi:hypothetical protein